jgi:hypothetical protein
LGLGGNLCRCGTYAGIKEAIVEAGKQASMSPTTDIAKSRTTGVGGAT